MLTVLILRCETCAEAAALFGADKNVIYENKPFAKNKVVEDEVAQAVIGLLQNYSWNDLVEQILLYTWKACWYSKIETSRVLGLSRTTIRKRLKELGH